MASTVTWTAKTVFGNKRVFVGTMTATDGTDEVASGLKNIDFGVHSPAAVTGAAPQCNMVINSTSKGNIKMTTGVSGMVYHVMLVGN